MTVSDRERAIKAIRRGVPLGEVVKCSCYTSPPTRNGCYGVCEDSVAAIITSYEDLRRETTITAALTEQVVVASGWRTDLENMPRDGSYLLSNDRGQVCPVQSRDGHRIMQNMVGFADWEYGSKVTAWQPLPAPPPEVSGE